MTFFAEMESPFTPGIPVDPRMFVGREAHVRELLDAARAARSGRFQVAYVSGERGMGKSSLVKMALHLAETQRGAAVAHANLGGVSDFAGLGRRAMEAAARDGESRSWGAKLLRALGDRVERVGMMGVDISLKAPERDWEFAGHNLPGEMAGLLKAIGENRAPMILALDDINGLADNPRFADWIKSAVESAARRPKQVPVLLILVGLEKRLRQMARHNPSVVRVFRPALFVESWTVAETREFFRRGFAANGAASGKTPRKALDICAQHSGGFPMLAHEIGRAVWSLSRKSGVTPETARAGVFAAAHSLGRQLQSGAADPLRGEKRRAVLRKIMRQTGASTRPFSRRDLLKKAGLSGDEKKALDGFLRRMREAGAIVADEESAERGTYRFPTMLHALYFQMATRSKSGQAH